jgi:hypothetical protein
MSIVLIRLKKKSNTNLVKKFLATLNEEANVLTDEEFRDSMFSKLLEEGRKSNLLPALEAKKELAKRGISL